MSPALLIMICLTGLLIIPVLLREKMVSEEVSLVVGLTFALAVTSVVASWQGGLSIESGSAATFQINDQQALVSARIFVNAAVVMLASGVLWYLLPLRQRSATPWGQEGLALAEHKCPTVGKLPHGTQGVLAELRATSLEQAFSPAVIRLVAAALLAFAGIVIATIGPAAISRDTYLFLEPGSLTALLGSISFPTAVVACAVLVASKDSVTRTLAGSALVLLLFFELSKSSRSAAVLVLACGFFYLVLGRSRLIFRLVVAAAFLVAAALTLNLVLQTRGSSIGHGLLPYIELARMGEISVTPDSLGTALNNILVTLSTSYYSSLKSVPDGFLSVSFDPRPGNDIGWYFMTPQLFLSWAVPTNAYGQIASLSPSGVILGWFLVAGMLSTPGIIRSHASRYTGFVLLLASMALTVLIAVMFLQYTLRTAMRWSWLAIAATLAVTLVDHGLQTILRRARPVPWAPNRTNQLVRTGHPRLE